MITGNLSRPQYSPASGESDPSARQPALAPLLDACVAGYLNQALDMPDMGTLTLAQLEILIWIGEHKAPVLWQDIRVEFADSSASPWRNVRYLMRRGLLRQCRRLRRGIFDDPKPRQASRVYFLPSATGRSLLLSMKVSESRYQGMLLNQLSADEQVALAGGVRLLLQALG